MKSNKESLKPSINRVVIPLIILSVIITITINILISSYTIKNNYLEEVKKDINQNAITLSKSIAGFVEAYNVNEYTKLIENELKNNDILAIIVDDFTTAQILGLKTFITGKIKTQEKVITYDSTNPKHLKTIKEAFYSKKIEITDSQKRVLGEIILYKSNDELNNKIKSTIYDNIIYGLFSALLIIGLIMFVLKKYLVRPIELIIKNLENNESSNEKFDSISKNIHLKEIDILFKAFNGMFKTIKKSNSELTNTKFELIQAQKIAQIGHFVLDVQSKKYQSSEVLDEIFELDADSERTFDSWINLVAPSDRKELDEYYQYILRNNQDFDKKYKIITHNNKEKWIHGIAIFQKDKDGIPIKLFGTIQDITKNIEYETKLSQALTVFNNTHDGIIVTDKDTQILNVNKSFEEITGYSEEEVLGKKPNILKSDIYTDEFFKNIWNTLNNTGSWSGEITNKNKNGDNYQEILTINVIKNNEGDVINYIGVFSDITLQKEQEKILFQQSRTSAVGEMIGNIAHQWRQPLSVISSASSGIQLHINLKGKIDNDTLLERLSMITKQTNYLSKTIDDFRNFFKGDSNSKKTIKLEETLQKVISLTKDSFTNNFIYIDLKLDETIEIELNENLFIQALINLFNNAKDALIHNLDEDRYFLINSYKKDGLIYLSITDNAGGVEEKNIDKLFDPYFTTKHKSVGTGLGLYMTHQIIQNHLKGTIKFNNSNITYKDKHYKGACFTIVLNTN